MIDKRRDEILNILNQSVEPVKGELLGEKLGVSRQVIVQDIAVLRAEGADIIATPRGYMVMKKTRGLVKTIVSQHDRDRELEEELRIIVGHGGRIIDVLVEHPVYGEISAVLDLSSPKDVDEFLKNLRKSQGEPLLALTGGIHLHRIEVESEEVFKRIEEDLLERNYLKK